jgi:hypothetical protein
VPDDPSERATESEREVDALKVDNTLPGGDQAGSQRAFDATVEAETEASQEPNADLIQELEEGHDDTAAAS